MPYPQRIESLPTYDIEDLMKQTGHLDGSGGFGYWTSCPSKVVRDFSRTWQANAQCSNWGTVNVENPQESQIDEQGASST